jgi:2-octaprenyl-6-methoxyphenol hydroxylase/2-octaprenylphenol hydroxylase
VLRTQLGIDVEVKHYAQHAVIANVETSEAHNGRAFERFTSEGPVALLPLGGDSNSKKSALVFTRPQNNVEETLTCDDEEFLALLQSTFGYRLGKFTRVGKRFSYPLSLSVAREQIRSSVVLMGNAAHFLHPVAGQGFNLALRDVAQLVAALSPVYLQRKQGNTAVRYGDLHTLLAYYDAQKKDQGLTGLISDTFNYLFSNEHFLKQAGRNVGLLALELNDGLKREVFHRMMGESHARAPLQSFYQLK